MKTFHILKFRTLCSKQAAALTSDKTLPADADIFTPLGQFLRDTRLDELPQILNIIMGDMNICGPRPVRAAIRDIHVADIPDYDIRFEVRPGLLGPTQAYFGHGASKRLRARMNNVAVRRPVSIRAEIGITMWIAGAMISRLARKLAKDRLLSKVFGVTRRDVALLTNDGKMLPIEHMNHDCLRIDGAANATEAKSVVVRLRNGGMRQAKVVLAGPHLDGSFEYTAANDVSAYMIERYALNKVVVPAPINRVKVPRDAVSGNVSMGAGARA